MARSVLVQLCLVVVAVQCLVDPALAQVKETKSDARFWFGIAANAVRLHSGEHDVGGLGLTGILGVPLSARWACELEVSRVWPSSHTREFVTTYYKSQADGSPAVEVPAPGRLTRRTHADVAALVRFQPQPAAPVDFAFQLGMAWRVERRHGVFAVPNRPAPGQLELVTQETTILQSDSFYAIGAELGVPFGSGLAIVLAARVEGQFPRDRPEAITRAGVGLRWRFR